MCIEKVRTILWHLECKNILLLKNSYYAKNNCQAQDQYHFKLYDIAPGDITPGDIATGDIVMVFHLGEVLTKLSNIVYCKNIGGL